MVQAHGNMASSLEAGMDTGARLVAFVLLGQGPQHGAPIYGVSSYLS